MFKSSLAGMPRFLAVAVMIASAGVASSASADWGSWGGGSWGGGSSGGSSFGGSSGSWGSSHGSMGSHGGRLFGGSHGGPIRNLISRIRSRHGSYGGGSSGGSFGGSSGGSFGGSSGGSSGGYPYYSASVGGSSGYSHVYGGSSGGSSGGYSSGAIYRTYSVPSWSGNGYPVQQGYPVDMGYPAGGTIYDPYNGIDTSLPVDGDAGAGESTPTDLSPGPEGADANPMGDDTAVLNVSLPAQAVVYVNGKRTRTPGSFRSYVSRNLEPGKRYTYEVTAEVEENGKPVSRTKVVQLTAGSRHNVDFDFDVQDQLLTSVTLFVPDNAKVFLGGAQTRAVGPVRYFSTTSLKNGEKWDDYTVRVVLDQNGEEVVREKRIDVAAGESVQLSFDFEDGGKIAAR